MSLFRNALQEAREAARNLDRWRDVLTKPTLRREYRQSVITPQNLSRYAGNLTRRGAVPYLKSVTEAPRAFGRDVGESVSARLSARRIGRSADSASDITSRNLARIKQLEASGRDAAARQLARKNLEMSSRTAGDISARLAPITERAQGAPARLASEGLRTGLTGYGMSKLPVGATALGGILGGGTAALSGKDVLTGFAEGAGSAPKYAALNRITAPFIDPLVAYAGMGKAPLAKVGYRALAHGGLNLAEDQLYTRLAQNRIPTISENVASLLLGAATSPFVPYKPEDSFFKITNKNKIYFDGDKFRNTLGQFAKETGVPVDKAAKELEDTAKWLNRDIKVTENGKTYTIKRWQDQRGFIRIPGGETPKGKVAGVGAGEPPKQLPLPWEESEYLSGKKPIDFDTKRIEDNVAKGELQRADMNRAEEVFNNIFSPLKNAPEDVQEAATGWRRQVLSGYENANSLAAKYSDIPEEDGWKMIRYMQDPTEDTAKRLNFDPKEYKEQMTSIRQTYDSMYKEATDKGLDVNYIKNYLNQVWEEGPTEIERRLRGLGTKPAFIKERKIPSYEEGLELGLTPKYTHPAQLAAHYRQALDRAVANKQLIKHLLDKGYVAPASKSPADWMTIQSPFVPKGKFRIDGKTVVLDDLKASPHIARALNSILGEMGMGGWEAVFKAGSNVSRMMQDLTLSGGVGPLNAFTVGNAIKDITAGRIKSPLTAFVRSWSPQASRDYFLNNKNYVDMMAEEGVPVRSNLDYRYMYDNLAKQKGFAKKFGDTFESLVTRPTFRRFMPMLNLNFFKDAYDSAIKSGIDPDEAKSIAASATKNFYGIQDNFDRPEVSEDILSTVFFAPYFRESMANFWINTAKSLKPGNISSRAFAANRKFLAGLGVTYLLYNALNKKLTGHPIWENKGGKEFFLEIPTEKDRSLYVPILPSVATLPRRGAEMLGKVSEGDIAGATQKAGSLLSQPVSLGSQLLTNRTFYGGNIYEPEDTPMERLGKLGGYAFEQTSHPLMGEPVAVMQGRKTPGEAMLGMLEMPAYPSSSSRYSDVYNNARELKLAREKMLNAIIEGDKKKIVKLYRKYQFLPKQQSVQNRAKNEFFSLLRKGKKKEALEVYRKFNVKLTKEDIMREASPAYGQYKQLPEVTRSQYVKRLQAGY